MTTNRVLCLLRNCPQAMPRHPKWREDIFDECEKDDQPFPELIVDECHLFWVKGVKTSDEGGDSDGNVFEARSVNGWEVHGRVGLNEVAVFV